MSKIRILVDNVETTVETVNEYFAAMMAMEQELDRRFFLYLASLEKMT